MQTVYIAPPISFLQLSIMIRKYSAWKPEYLNTVYYLFILYNLVWPPEVDEQHVLNVQHATTQPAWQYLLADWSLWSKLHLNPHRAVNGGVTTRHKSGQRLSSSDQTVSSRSIFHTVRDSGVCGSLSFPRHNKVIRYSRQISKPFQIFRRLLWSRLCQTSWNTHSY